MTVRYIKTKHSYFENSYSNHKKTDIDGFVKMIKENDDSYSIFEIIEYKYYQNLFLFVVSNDESWLKY